MGKLIFRYGAMSSGKSLNLLNVNYNYTQNGSDVLIFKPSSDTRGIGVISTRLSEHLTAPCVTFEKNEDLFEKYLTLCSENGKDYEVVLIDESQFITAKQANQLARIAYEEKKTVIAYGLKVDFMGRPFEGSAQLISMAGNIEEIKTICEVCGRHKAIFPMLYIKGELIRDAKSNVVIDQGDDVKYVQVCGECYFEILKKAHKNK